MSEARESPGIALFRKPVRLCGGCTECCRTFPLDLRVDLGTVSLGGKEFSRTLSLKSEAGEYCSKCRVGVGCGIYEKRPTDPCQTFRCMWLNDPKGFDPVAHKKVPLLAEDDRPDKRGFILAHQVLEDHGLSRSFRWLRIIECAPGAASGDRGTELTKLFCDNGFVVSHLKVGCVHDKTFFPPHLSTGDLAALQTLFGL